MISWKTSGDTSKTEAWLKKIASGNMFANLDRFGAEGVAALASATPKDKNVTANSWYYEIVQDGKSYSIIWGNNNIEDGQVIAVLLQVGHGTRTGGYVQGRDYINPALQPIFDKIATEAWKVVTS